MAEAKPRCKLIGTDGNVFSIIGKVSKTLKNEGFKEQAEEFVKKAYKCESYQNVLALCNEYVEVE